MRPLRAVLLGAAAGAVLVYVAAATVALTLTAAGLELDAALGPVRFLTLARDAGGSEVTFGPGLAAIPVLCGVANGAAAAVFASRAR